MTPLIGSVALMAMGVAICVAGCASTPTEPGGGADDVPPATRAWMDRLTVAHAYDPKTGFIVARETVALPAIVAQGPRLDEAVTTGGSERIVIAFATADRCAPCQQYKKDAINNADVVARLSRAPFVPTHVEVDREPELAERYLGTRGIPMTYALREGKVIGVLRGQRSAAELAAWLDGLP